MGVPAEYTGKINEASRDSDTKLTGCLKQCPAPLVDHLDTDGSVIFAARYVNKIKAFAKT